jgi:cysteine desulfuration protein SufE
VRLDELLAEFRELEVADRLEALVELAGELPPVSPARRTESLPADCRVQECQTPVYVWVDVREGRVHLEAEVPRQSPTVRGLVTLVVLGLEGGAPEEVLALPVDLLPLLGLHEALGMTRQRGLQGLMSRIHREVRRLSCMHDS